MQKLPLIAVASLAFLFLASGTAAEERAQYPGTTWRKVAKPEKMGWSASHLAQARVFSEKIGSTAVMIVQHGVVIDEWGEVATKSPAHSVRKSLLSALIGIAVAEQKIDLTDTMADLGIDDYEPSLTDVEKQATVGDLIKARSGIYHPALYETKRMTASKPRRGSYDPGTFWHYNNWDFNALGTIYRQETGEDIFEAFGRRIATPLQMQDYVPADGEYIAGSKSVHDAYPFRISARDLARFGLLYLRNGKWNDQQVVPEAWVKTSTVSHSKTGADKGYGYMWWTGRGSFRSLNVKGHSFHAAGYRRQYAFVFPYLDLIVVHRINSDTSKAFPHKRQIERLLWHIFAAAGETENGPDPTIEHAEGDRLTGKVMQRMLPGATLTGIGTRSQNPYRVTLFKDGRLTAFAGSMDEFQDEGSWRIENDKYCRQYKKWTRGRDLCFSVVKTGKSLRFYDNTGTYYATTELKTD
jgi:CubicO group peptidase (beta-lactamase class C family)